MYICTYVLKYVLGSELENPHLDPVAIDDQFTVNYSN